MQPIIGVLEKGNAISSEVVDFCQVSLWLQLLQQNDRLTWEALSPSSLTDPFHHRVCKSVVGLTCITPPTTDGGEDHKPIQAVLTGLPANLIQVKGTCDFRLTHQAELLFCLVFHQSIFQDLDKIQWLSNR